MYRIQLNAAREAWWKLDVHDPEAGKVKTRVRYRLLDTDEIAAWLDEGLGEGDPDAESSESRIESLRRALDPERRADLDRRLADRIVDWEFADEAGEKLACTTDTKLAVLKIPYLREPIDRGLFEASRGAARKN